MQATNTMSNETAQQTRTVSAMHTQGLSLVAVRLMLWRRRRENRKRSQSVTLQCERDARH